MMKIQKTDLDWLRDNPEYLNMMDQLIQYEKNLEPEEDDRILERHEGKTGREYEVKWKNTDVPFNPSKLYQLEVHGFLDRVFDSRSTTLYSIINRDDLEQKVKEIDNQFNDGVRTVIHEFPNEEELEEKGIFDDVVGYEEVKFLMRRAMSSDEIVNILLVGPPGSAKTVFLMCINKLGGSEFISGKPTSGPGFMDVMFEEEPRYIAIDEFDDMENDHQKNLSDYTETGMLIETKGNSKKRRMRTNTKTFAAANSVDSIIDSIQNRFVDLHFDPYTKDEFIEVCEHIIPRNEDQTRAEAKKIAEAVWDFDGFGNVRKAIQAARLSRGDPEKVLDVLDQYSQSGLERLG